MAGGQLRPLLVLPLEEVAHAVQQLDVALLRVLLERGDEGPGHGARRLRVDRRVGPNPIMSFTLFPTKTPQNKRQSGKKKKLKGRGRGGNLRSLAVLAPAPHNNIRRTRLRLLRLLIRAAAHGALREPEDAAGGAHDVAAAVGRHGGEEALGGLLGEVGLLEHALCRVQVRQVEHGARVARVDDGGEAHARLQGFHDCVVDLVIDDVACGLEVDGVEALVVAVFFVAV